jgi:hypothetical protein
MCTPALPKPIPAVDAARLCVSCRLAAQRSRILARMYTPNAFAQWSVYSQHLRASFLIAKRIISNPRQVFDRRLERPARKDVGERV